MTLADPILPSVDFERRWCYQAIETAIARGEPEIIVRGPRGTGKTLGLADLLYRLCLIYPGMVQIWLRRNFTLMAESVVSCFEDEVLGLGHPLRTGPERSGRKGYSLPNGSRIIITGLDDVERLKSVSADVIWCNEVNQLAEREWEELGASSRQRAVAMRFGLQVKIGDCNPAPPGHWTNARCRPFPQHLYPRVTDDGSNMGQCLTPEMYGEIAEWNLTPSDRSRERAKLIVSTHADNPGYWSIDPWGWLPAGHKYATDVLGRLSGHLKARYLEGRPVTLEGAVYPEFDESRHVISPFAIPRNWPVHVAKDPGRDHPDATVFAAIAPNERMYLVAESCVRQTTTEQDAQTLTKMCQPFNVVRKLGDPHYMFSLTKMSDTGRTIAEQMRDFGHVFEPAPAARNQTEIAQQVDMVRTRLTSIASDGEPMLQVFRTCPNTIRGFQTWGYKRDRSGRMLGGEDRFEDVGDDECDCVRMLVASDPRYEQPEFIVHTHG